MLGGRKSGEQGELRQAVRVIDDRLDWVRAAHDAIAARAEALTDEQLVEPSLLPGWTRAHVLAHLARNADGLRNLVRWAATGVETPMYGSFEARAADIEATASLAPDQLRAEVVDADAALLAELERLDDAAAATEVQALRGGPFPARDLPWVRAREAWVHLVDLDAGVTFADVPTDVLDHLLAEAVERAPERDLTEGLVLVEQGSGRRWVLGPEDPSVTVTGRRAELVEWLTGREPGDGLAAGGPLPAPPTWP